MVNFSRTKPWTLYPKPGVYVFFALQSAMQFFLRPQIRKTTPRSVGIRGDGGLCTWMLELKNQIIVIPTPLQTFRTGRATWSPSTTFSSSSTRASTFSSTAATLSLGKYKMFRVHALQCPYKALSDAAIPPGAGGPVSSRDLFEILLHASNDRLKGAWRPRPCYYETTFGSSL